MNDSPSPRRATALITGASRGIGRAVAIELATHGHAIAINYRSARGEAERVADTVRSMGVEACVLQADMSDVTQAAELFDRSQAALGNVRIVVNNAGITRDRLLIQMSEDDWAATWQTDFVGPRALACIAAHRMAESGGGRIVNVSSVVGVTGNAGQANYAAAKSALMGLTREMAVRCAGRGVTVNCVIPGYIETDATSHLTPDQREYWLRRIPMRRFAEPAETVGLIAFLVGQHAAYITGQCIAVDGGMLAGAAEGLFATVEAG